MGAAVALPQLGLNWPPVRFTGLWAIAGDAENKAEVPSAVASKSSRLCSLREIGLTEIVFNEEKREETNAMRHSVPGQFLIAFVIAFLPNRLLVVNTVVGTLKECTTI
jgi:hypothetical protein